MHYRDIYNAMMISQKIWENLRNSMSFWQYANQYSIIFLKNNSSQLKQLYILENDTSYKSNTTNTFKFLFNYHYVHILSIKCIHLLLDNSLG